MIEVSFEFINFYKIGWLLKWKEIRKTNTQINKTGFEFDEYFSWVIIVNVLNITRDLSSFDNYTDISYTIFSTTKVCPSSARKDTIFQKRVVSPWTNNTKASLGFRNHDVIDREINLLYMACNLNQHKQRQMQQSRDLIFIQKGVGQNVSILASTYSDVSFISNDHTIRTFRLIVKCV